MTTEDKKKFRNTKQWKEFRIKKRKEQKVDILTEKPLTKGYNLHHCNFDDTEYTNISNEDNFIGLNSMSHDVIHFFYGDPGKIKDWRKLVINLIKILKKMEKINEIR